MSIFKMYNLDFGFKVTGTKYEFTEVASLAIDDPEENTITRGSNAANKIGIAYKQGLRDPKRWTIPIMDMTAAHKAVLDDCYKKQTRIEVYAIDREDGSGKWAKSAVVAKRPQQLSLDDTPESMQVALEFVTFDSEEVHKS